MTHHGNSFITYLINKKKLSDIEYLSIKEFDGKLRTDEGALSAVGDLATLTANTGKDMYLARAKVVFYFNNTTFDSSMADQVALKINGVTVEIARSSMSFGGEGTSAGAGLLTTIYDFKNIGHKVAASEIIKLEVLNLTADVDVVGFVECFEEDTGVSPAI